MPHHRSNNFTYEELAQCAQRELNLRKRVYPNRLLTNRMTPQQAEREMAMMQAILTHFRKLADQEAPQLQL